VAPSDWATCRPMICLYHTVNVPSVHSQLPCHRCTAQSAATSASIQHSQLPCQHPYSPVTMPRQHLYNPFTLPRQISYSQLSSVLARVSLSLGHVMYRLPRVIRTMPCVKYILVQHSPKTPNLSDTCHLKVVPCHHDVTCHNVDVSSMTC
jgi:hypothetical protein